MTAPTAPDLSTRLPNGPANSRHPRSGSVSCCVLSPPSRPANVCKRSQGLHAAAERPPPDPSTLNPARTIAPFATRRPFRCCNATPSVDSGLGLEAISGVFPVPVRGIDSDNYTVFINETLVGYCEENEIEFTRSRAYRKNDQAWIEQKNGSVIRRFVGHERHSGAVAGQTMAHLYGAMRLYVNYFQPSFQLLTKSRNGGSVTKRYSKPATPCDRLLDSADVSEEMKSRLRQNRAALDPVSLLHSIRKSQAALAAIGSVESGGTPDGESLESFLSQLPDLWRSGEVRPTHARRARAARGWRTRPDPFEGVWCEVLSWLQQQPDAPAAELMDRLIWLYPERYSRRQLRTLQRRVSQWRGVMAKQLVYASAESREGNSEVRPVDFGPVGVN